MPTHDEVVNDIANILRMSGIMATTKLDLNAQADGQRITDIDVMGVYNNILFYFEVRGEQDRLRDKEMHLHNLVQEIADNQTSFLREFKERNREASDAYIRFANRHVHTLILVDPSRDRFPTYKKGGIHYWGADLIEYFRVISDNSFEHAKFELMYSLGVRPSALVQASGEDSSELSQARLKGILVDDAPFWKIVTLRMHANNLLKRSIVLRYHGWAETEGFQRMLSEKKLERMRDYLLKNRISYPNNVIAVLDPRTGVSRQTGQGVVNVTLPDSFGAFKVIDGQHRLFSFAQDSYKKVGRATRATGDSRIRQLAIDKYLVVTAIKYKSHRNEDRLNAGLFLDINTNQTRIAGEDILDVYEIVRPVDEELRRQVQANKLVKMLDAGGPLAAKFKIKFYAKGKVARPSLIRYGGLADLFSDRSNIRMVYDGLQTRKPAFLKYCKDVIDVFFDALYQSFVRAYGSTQADIVWNDTAQKAYMLMSVTSLAGFFRLLNRHFLSAPTNAQYLNHLADPLRNHNTLVGLLGPLLDSITQGVRFDKNTWSTYKYKSSQWFNFERELVRLIRTGAGASNFGDFQLVP